MRVRSCAAERSARVTLNAISLDVTRDTLGQRATSLHRVVLVRHNRARPPLERWVKTPSTSARSSRAHRDARARVAPHAEALLAVTAGASVARHPRFDRVKREVVVRVRAPIANAAIVALDALALAVAVHATLGIGRGDPAVIHPEIRVVVHSVHPPRRVEPALGEARSKHAVCFGEMAARAARARAASLVAARALAHRRKVEARRERRRAHRAVTVVAAHVRAIMQAMRKAQIRCGNLHSRHGERPRWIEALVAARATGARRRRALGLGPINRVTARAHRLRRNESIARLFARSRIAVAPLAGHAANREVLAMIEPQRNPLRRNDRPRRPALISARKLPHARPRTKRGRAVAHPARRAERERQSDDHLRFR